MSYKKFYKDFDEKKFLKLMKEFDESVVIVEGARDKIAVKKLFKKIKVFVYSQKNFYEKLMKAKPKEVVILTDNDKEGRKIKKEIEERLRAENILVNNNLRKEFFEVFKISKVEELTSVLEKNDTILNILDLKELKYF